MESLRTKPYFINLLCKYLWSTCVMASTILDAQGKSDEHVKTASEKRLPQGAHNLGGQGTNSNHSKQCPSS